MKIIRPYNMEAFILSMIANDFEISKICDEWEIEREEVIAILTSHFLDMGIFTVHPLRHADVIRKEIVFQLRSSPEIKKRRAQIQREIAKARERSRARIGE